MLGIGVVFFAGLQVILAQSQTPLQPPAVSLQIPVECIRPPKVEEKPHDCCVIPPFFSEEDFTACGFKKFDDVDPNERRAPPDCSKQLCMMKKYNLLKDETTIDPEALSLYMDNWAADNPHFQSVIAKTKDRCIGRPLPGPPQICDANKLVFCISSTLFTECPVWQETQGCKTLKTHMDLCKPFFRKP